MNTEHRWNTKEYEERTRQLYRTDLHKLYPSEAWALYRILPRCQSILDLGCGNGAMAAIAKQIAPQAHYIGMDHQEHLMEEARKVFPFADFHAGDLSTYLDHCESVDCVMSWSVLKSFGDWRDLIAGMLNKSKGYVICDIRVANTDREDFDEKVCWADYGGRRGPIAFLNYTAFRDALLAFKDILSRLEVVAYQSEWGPYVHFAEGLHPDTFLVTCVLAKKGAPQLEPDQPFELFERLPGNLQR